MSSSSSSIPPSSSSVQEEEETLKTPWRSRRASAEATTSATDDEGGGGGDQQREETATTEEVTEHDDDDDDGESNSNDRRNNLDIVNDSGEEEVGRTTTIRVVNSLEMNIDDEPETLPGAVHVGGPRRLRESSIQTDNILEDDDDMDDNHHQQQQEEETSVVQVVEASLVHEQESSEELRSRIRQEVEQDILGTLTQAEVLSLSATVTTATVTTATTATAIVSAGDTDTDGSILQQQRQSQPHRTSSSVLERSQTVEQQKNLDFENVGIYGRDEEISVLRQSFNHVLDSSSSSTSSSTSPNRQVVLISGDAGTGKTKLLNTLHDPIVQHRGTYIVSKCNPDVRMEPYSTIISIVRLLCHEVESLRGGSFQTFRDTLISSIGDVVVTRIASRIPELESIVGTDFVTRINEQPDDRYLEGQDWRDRFHDGFLNFLRLVCSTFQPLAIAIDDIQWADDSSLSVLKSLVNDPSLRPGILVVVTYREASVQQRQETTADNDFITDLRSHTSNNNSNSNSNSNGDDDESFAVTEVRMKTMEITHINQVLVDLLDSTPDRTMSLADVCQRRTGGNIYYTMLFLAMLCDKKLIRYESESWKWDLEVIETNTEATENVFLLLRRKIETLLSPETSQLLCIAACLGHTFRQSTLRLVWESMDVVNSSAAFDISDGLHRAVSEGIIEKVNDTSYRFIHEGLREASLSFNAEEDEWMFRERIGWILLENVSELEDIEIYVCLDLLDRSSIPTDESKRLQLSNMYLTAAELCRKISSFSRSQAYAKKGIACLSDNDWHDSLNRTLCLGLHSLVAEGAWHNGDDEVVVKICDKVETNNLSTEEAIPFKFYLIQSLGRSTRVKEALNFGIDFLRTLGCRLPRNVVSTSAQTMISLLNFNSLKETCQTLRLESLPLLTDRNDIARFDFLHCILAYSFFAGEDLLFVVSTFRSVQWTLDKGIAEYSPFCFGALGHLTMHFIGDWEAAICFAEKGLAMLHRLKQKYRSSHAILASNYVLTYSNLMTSRLDHLFLGYQKGFEYGDSEIATYNLGLYVGCKFLGGNTLPSSELDCQTWLPTIEKSSNEEAAGWVRSIFASVHLLMGEMGISEFVDALESRNANTESKVHNNFPLIMANYAYTYLGLYKRGAEIACTVGKQLLDQPPYVLDMVGPFSRGLCCLIMADSTLGMRRRRYLRVAGQNIKRLDLWARKGNPNIIHQLKILQAERLAIRRRRSDRPIVEQLYKESKLVASNNGFFHDEALANERLAKYLSSVGDAEGSIRALEDAINGYKRWGATAKVESLRHELLQKQE